MVAGPILDGARGRGPIGCLLVARLPLACELADRPELWHRPAAVAHPDAAAIWSASPAATAEGVIEGQRLSEAVGRCPSLVVFDPRPAHYESVAAAVLDALEEVVPGVEPAEPGTAYVDLSGAGHVHGSPAALHAALLSCAPSELRPRLGVGPSTFVARLAAFRARPGSEGVREVGPEQVASFTAPVPVDALPVPAEVHRRLRLVGIATIAELDRLPRSALVAQFGSAGARLAELLDGVVEPVRPRSRQEPVLGCMSLLEPLARREAVLAAAAHALDRALRQPRRGERVARQVVARMETEQGRRWEATVTLREPRGDREGVWGALGPVLERASLPGPVSEISVELSGLRPPQGWQNELLAGRTDRAHRRRRLDEALQQLHRRYGRSLVGRMARVDPDNRIPERRWALVEV